MLKVYRLMRAHLSERWPGGAYRGFLYLMHLLSQKKSANVFYTSLLACSGPDHESRSLCAFAAYHDGRKSNTARALNEHESIQRLLFTLIGPDSNLRVCPFERLACSWSHKTELMRLLGLISFTVLSKGLHHCLRLLGYAKRLRAACERSRS